MEKRTRRFALNVVRKCSLGRQKKELMLAINSGVAQHFQNVEQWKKLLNKIAGGLNADSFG